MAIRDKWRSPRRDTSCGTPLVAAGGQLLNLLFKLGEDTLGALPVVSPLSKAYGYLVDSPALPPGIQAMAEDAAGIGTLNAMAIDIRFAPGAAASTFIASHRDLVWRSKACSPVRLPIGPTISSCRQRQRSPQARDSPCSTARTCITSRKALCSRPSPRSSHPPPFQPRLPHRRLSLPTTT